MINLLRCGYAFIIGMLVNAQGIAAAPTTSPVQAYRTTMINEVRNAVEQNTELPSLGRNIGFLYKDEKILQGMSALGYRRLQETFETSDIPATYTLTRASFVETSTTLNGSFEVLIIKSTRVTDAIDSMYLLMGSCLSSVITKDLFGMITNGPGNRAYYFGNRPVNNVVNRKIWFIRDSVVVQVTGSRSINLLPIANIIDKNIVDQEKE